MTQIIGCLVRHPGKPLELLCDAPRCPGAIRGGRLDCAPCRYAQILRSDPTIPLREAQAPSGNWHTRLARWLGRAVRR